MNELPVRVILDPTAPYTVSYDGERLVVRLDAEPRDVGWLLLSLLGQVPA